MMKSNFVKIVFVVEYVDRLSSVMYDHFVDMSFANKMMRLPSMRCDHSDEMSLYTRVVIDVIH